MTSKTEVKGLENFNKLDRVISKGISRSLKLSGLFIRGKAQKKFKALPGIEVRTSKKGNRYYHYKGKVPGSDPHIRTGRLRGSISTFPDNPTDFVVVGTNVQYGSYVELGTSKQRPRSFLRSAALESKQAVLNIFKNIIGDNIRLVVK